MTELIASAAKRDAARIGALAGLVAGPVFLASVGLNTWASLDYLHGLEWEFVGGEEVPWPSSLARGPHAWEQIATFVVTGLLVVLFAFSLRDNLPREACGIVRGGAARRPRSGADARRVPRRRADAPRRGSRDLERLGARDRIPRDHRDGWAELLRKAQPDELPKDGKPALELLPA